jgi:hypothetical protein
VTPCLIVLADAEAISDGLLERSGAQPHGDERGRLHRGHLRSDHDTACRSGSGSRVHATVRASSRRLSYAVSAKSDGHTENRDVADRPPPEIRP